MNTKDVFDGKSREEWISLIQSWVHNEVDRKMLIRHHLDGICLEPLAEEFELSTNRCQERISKARDQLFKHI